MNKRLLFIAAILLTISSIGDSALADDTIPISSPLTAPIAPSTLPSVIWPLPPVTYSTSAQDAQPNPPTDALQAKCVDNNPRFLGDASSFPPVPVHSYVVQTLYSDPKDNRRLVLGSNGVAAVWAPLANNHNQIFLLFDDPTFRVQYEFQQCIDGAWSPTRQLGTAQTTTPDHKTTFSALVGAKGHLAVATQSWMPFNEAPLSADFKTTLLSRAIGTAPSTTKRSAIVHASWGGYCRGIFGSLEPNATITNVLNLRDQATGQPLVMRTAQLTMTVLGKGAVSPPSVTNTDTNVSSIGVTVKSGQADGGDVCGHDLRVSLSGSLDDGSTLTFSWTGTPTNSKTGIH
jgi:hypothetical protein